MNKDTDQHLNQSASVDKDHAHEHDPAHDMVTIYINDTPFEVHQGYLEVATIRKLDDIPSTDVIYKLPEYELLPNNGFVVVHGGERFKSGGSSGHRNIYFSKVGHRQMINNRAGTITLSFARKMERRFIPTFRPNI